ncbi:hypothetical protein P691DRAFT_758368 [Macrolepiota fuliginosa MF-IS2]|uniref:Uncharacterized protein n=1 Tax=Macrolepiota fuliginosa MF-IS2 TaxID=1400762 RepID=A0A9P5XF31_9AGAR|nr:hypothetical protein P691DRAFT_758368 [Macrolepiota fuliginosa MF-IS2]
MSKYLSSNQLGKINQWLEEIQTSPILLHPLHGIVQEVFHEAPANIRELQVPTYNFRRATEKRSVGKWKSQYVAKSSREKLRPDDYQIRIYCERLGLDQAFRRELNTVASMSSLPHAETNELVTDSRTVVKGEFVRVLQIRNSFYAEQQLYAALLCQRGLSPEVTIFYEMRQSECAYGCDKAQEAAQYIQSYGSTEKMSIDFEVLLSVLPYPEVVEEADTFLTTSSSSGSSTDLTSSETMVSSAGKNAHLRKEAISEADFNNWKDRWIFQMSHRSSNESVDL